MTPLIPSLPSSTLAVVRSRGSNPASVAAWLLAACVSGALSCQSGEIKKEPAASTAAPAPVKPAAAPPTAASKPPPAPEPAGLPAPADVAAPPEAATKTASGLASTVLQAGTGKEHPAPADRVKVHYTGWTKDGKMFDSSVPRNEPTEFGVTQVIKGWTEGLQLMVAGEKRRFWIPSELAYGDTPRRPGAPSGQLTFDVELLEIIKPPPPPEVPKDVAKAPASAKKTASGLQYRVLKPGTGTVHPTATRRRRTQPLASQAAIWRGGRVVECGGLENRYGRFLVHRGFESLPLRSYGRERAAEGPFSENAIGLPNADRHSPPRAGRRSGAATPARGLSFNNNYAGLALGLSGTAYLGVIGGIVALRDGG